MVGMGAGALTTLAYVVFEASLVGICSFFASTFATAHLGLKISWIWFALLMLVVNAVLTYFDINLTAKVLGAFLVTEILMLGLMAVAVFVAGGGPEGWSLGSLNPLNAFQNLHATVPNPSAAGATLAVTGSAGIGLFFAFWSWVGFESAAMYGEESKNPKRIIPKATMLSVVPTVENIQPVVGFGCPGRGGCGFQWSAVCGFLRLAARSRVTDSASD
ncbi:amino acid permease [Spirillospora sp. CA-255316]